MPAPFKRPVISDSSRLGTRLEGWKTIASYLDKAERTVKRWEVNRGLPIHRVPGGGRAVVYCIAAELDAWLESNRTYEDWSSNTSLETETHPRSSILDPLPESAPHQILPREATHILSFLLRRRLILTAIGLLAVCVTAGAFHFSRTPSAALPLLGVPKPRKPNSQPGATVAVSDADKILARDYYLKGRYEWNQRTPDSLNRALDLFTQAIVHDPGYPQAYAGLADTYDLLREYTTMPENDAFPRAIAAARKAVELDDSLAEAHRALAFAEMYGNWDFIRAEKEFRRAIELDPKDAQARRWYANAFAVSGRFEESLDQLNKAQELDPSSHATLADKGALLADAGRTEEAVELLRDVERSAPDFRSPHAYLMRIGLERGDYSTFLSEGDKTAETMNDAVLKDILAAARAGYVRDGSRGLLKSLYARQKEQYLAGKLGGTTLAKTCVLLGKKQEALQLLEVAYSRRETEVLACLSHPDLLTLKDEPRYKALVKKINFPIRPPSTHPNNTFGSDAPHLAFAAPPH